MVFNRKANFANGNVCHSDVFLYRKALRIEGRGTIQTRRFHPRTIAPKRTRRGRDAKKGGFILKLYEKFLRSHLFSFSRLVRSARIRRLASQSEPSLAGSPHTALRNSPGLRLSGLVVQNL